MVVDTIRAAPHNERTVSAVTIYRAVLGVSIVANLIVGVFIFGWPDAFAHVMGQPEAFPKGWPRHWGMQLWAINLLYLPGFWDPEQNRWPNWLGIAIRFTFAAFFFSQGNGFTPMGIYDATFGLLLLIAYLPVTRVTKLRS
jgi:hypothetical protein